MSVLLDLGNTTGLGEFLLRVFENKLDCDHWIPGPLHLCVFHLFLVLNLL